MTRGMKLLAFCSQHLRPLGRVPGLPLALDAMLLLLSVLTSPRVFHLRRLLAKEVLGWPGVYRTSHVYGGIQFNVGERELGHLHGNGVLDLLFNRRLRNELVGAGQAFAHHTFPDSGWVSLALFTGEDVQRAIELLRTAYCWRTGATVPPEASFPVLFGPTNPLSGGPSVR